MSSKEFVIDETRCVECGKIFEFKRPMKPSFSWGEPDLCSKKCSDKSLLKFTKKLESKMGKLLSVNNNTHRELKKEIIN